MTGTCAVPECQRPRDTRGWCSRHYRRWQRWGDPLGGRHPRTGCTVPECPKPHKAFGWCMTHYERWRRHGDPSSIPSLDVDETAVERAVRGERAGALTRAELKLAVARLYEAGLSDPQIGARTGLTAAGARAVRLRLGLPSKWIRAGRPGVAA
ncbi:hypothetical protein ABZ714_34340 [Streptomyces sp. NPDC006798]|uniref:hypothetical protein n=1 Tax=Streptomyces sp. NPDC006798 TaxID=3155462 RepID=UPI0033CC4CAF